MRHKYIYSLLVPLTTININLAYANVGQIPKDSGLSGFLHGGLSAISYDSNFYSGENSNANINDLGQPDNASGINPLLNFDIRYTFADSRTQIFLGNLIQDAIRFDFTQQLGIRQEWSDKGILAGSVVFNAMPIEQWTDPFSIGVERQSTDIKSKGARFSWDNIWGSNFYGSITTRVIEVDEEKSGHQYDTKYGTETAALLDRNGKVHALDLSYQWQVAPGHILEPALIYRQAALDGGAQSYKSNGMQLTYAKRSSQWSFVSNTYIGKTKFDEANPIFGQSADSDEFLINGTFFWHKLFGINPLSATFTAGYSKSNSDISFYDAEMTVFSTGLLYNF
ncbi:DUF2860 family protein [Aeromonas rivipollensis]|uniref:DUF2860 domain-containing protein n=1 Tax=Aeromonas rivipollensis TaxID=948519 RepID=A0AAW9Y509_9GAMM|nr:DUF2860 family protein [Aeromonas rivipollensis]NEX73601.1 DUF2860 domain-containing protein [Aeromonas rivipollensis]